MPPVASPASLLPSPLPAIGLSKGAGPARAQASPFSLLLQDDTSPASRPSREDFSRPAPAAPKRTADQSRADDPIAKDSEAAPSDPPESAEAEPAEKAENTKKIMAAEVALAEVDPAADTSDGDESADPALAALLEVPVAAVQPVAELTVALDAAPAVSTEAAPVDEAVPVVTSENASPAERPVQITEVTPAAAAAQVSQPTAPAASQEMPSSAPAIQAQAAPDTAPADAEEQTAAAAAQSQARSPSAAADNAPNPDSQIGELANAGRAQADGAQLHALQAPRDFGQFMAATARTVASGTSQSAAAPVPLEGIAVEIASRAQAGRNRFEIRLDPPELGRIEVRLDIDRSGQVTSRLLVDKAETLDVLRRDAHVLERALQDAGLKTADNGMQFTLRDQAFAGRGDGEAASSGQAAVAESEPAPSEPLLAGYGRVLHARSGVDILI